MMLVEASIGQCLQFLCRVKHVKIQPGTILYHDNTQSPVARSALRHPRRASRLNTLHRNEQYSCDSKTAQDQSWRREAVRGTTFLSLSRRCRFYSSSPPIIPRYQKELALYRTEVVENQRKLQSLTATASTNGEGGESWDVKNAVRKSSITLPPHALHSNE